MLKLNGKNLGQRQKDLNFKVQEAFAHKVSVDQMKIDTEESDIDKLFKIDLAAKTKNINYIIEILKDGDELYISRALKKCTWLGDEEFENVINVQYLEENVFPQMSSRMKKKLLCTIPFYLRNSDIIAEFYYHCMRNQLTNEASKFLLIANETLKYKVIEENKGLPCGNIFERDTYVADFVKDSFPLLEKYLEVLSKNERNKHIKRYVLDSTKHFYSKSDEKFLFLMETHDVIVKLGNRISKHIIKKHKQRVLDKPEFYLKCLSRSVLERNTNAEEAKIYVTKLFDCENVDKYYELRNFRAFYRCYHYIINKIPNEEKFGFLKNIFLRRCPNHLFEKDKMFYSLDFYEIMTDVEREEWALSQIESNEEILGAGNDFLWYKFVSFDKAFTSIKKLILLESDRDQRIVILQVLIDSAKSQNDIQTLLTHFYARHVNEMSQHKEQFLNTLISTHKVLDFNEDCWKAFEKVCYSLQAFNTHSYDSTDSQYRTIALLYYVIHDKKVPEVLNTFIDMDVISLYALKGFCRTPQEKQAIFEYLLLYFINKLNLLSVDYYENTKDNIKSYCRRCLDLLHVFDKTEGDIPEIVNKFVSLEYSSFENHSLIRPKKLSENDTRRYLKTDASLLVSDFPKLKQLINNIGQINWILRKLRVYFAKDIGVEILRLLVDCLSDTEIISNLAKVSVYAVYVLGDETYKQQFLTKYEPKEPKIDHAIIPRNLLYIREAICRLVQYSRPVFPLQKFQPYIVGDYIHFCIPMINAYRAKLPMPKCLDFVENIINKPVSIQKHGIKLAFTCFTIENLKSLIERTWAKTKNVSMRKVIYVNLFHKVTNEKNSDNQKDLFDLLLKLTRELNEDDDESIFCLLCTPKMPRHLELELMITEWRAVNSFPDTGKKYQRLAVIVSCMRKKIDLVDEAIEPIINCYIDETLVFGKLPDKPVDLVNLQSAKQALLFRYLMYFNGDVQFQKKRYLMKRILQCSIECWNKVLDNKYVVKAFFYNYVDQIISTSYDNFNEYRLSSQYLRGINSILNDILLSIIELIPSIEVATLIWDLRINILIFKIIADSFGEGEPNDSESLMTIVKNTVHQLANEIANLMRQSKAEGNYNSLFDQKIKNDINESVRNMVDAVTNYWQNIKNIHLENFNASKANLIFCEYLLETDDREMGSFAISLLKEHALRKNPDCFSQIMNKIKNINDVKIQELVFHKFVCCNDFKVL